ncbi:MAG: GH92 family glycosyl hydrolase [Acidimicrobiales bacterium]
MRMPSAPAIGMALVMSAASLAAVGTPGAPAAGAAPGATGGPADPASYVDPFIGTGVGPGETGAIGTFPGADVPFGMVQWSPDTPTTNQALGVSGGYYYPLDTIDGFSLTHLSGAGCTAFEDFPVVPYAGAVTASPVTAPTRFESMFSHDHESASPGSYSVRLSGGIEVGLTVTDRTGIGRFVFPHGVTPSILVDPEASEGGFSTGELAAVGDRSLTGSAVAGGFCDLPGDYAVHFAAEFESPFRSVGTWEGGTLRPGGRRSSGPAPGVYATFPASAHGPTTVTMKVGLSYTSVADAAANLRAEQTGWRFDAVRLAAARTWNRLLSRVTVAGGTTSQRRVFYTALYHSLLFPSLFSDVNGDYPGLDGRVHVARGVPQYTNVSGWDVYRCEVPLLAVLTPSTADGLVTSLLRDAAQDGGFLPRWELADVNENEMGGDSADPIIAGAFAFGARSFDATAALAAMVRAADDPAASPPPAAHGYVERPGNAGYLADGYVPTEAGQVTGETSSLSPDMASLTLEYAVDDFAISRLADALGRRSTAGTFVARSQNWRHLFDPATGQMAPRSADGALPAGWPTGSFQLSDTLAAHGITGVGQFGFQEGDAAQYTWMVPQDVAGLASDLGGRAAATAELERFLRRLNAGPTAPYDWAGNEQDLEVPFEADYLGAPWLTERATTEILDRLYADAPAGEPGNDDLGAMSSWAVWSMLGLYPETPGTATLVTTVPVFSSAVVHLGDGRLLSLHAVGARPGAASISKMTVDGRSWDRPWLPAATVLDGGTVDVTLVAHPDRAWGSAPADAPPSYGR